MLRDDKHSMHICDSLATPFWKKSSARGFRSSNQNVTGRRKKSPKLQVYPNAIAPQGRVIPRMDEKDFQKIVQKVMANLPEHA